MRPAMAHEPTPAGKDSGRGPAQAIGCCAHGIRYVTHLCRLGSDAHWLAPETSITDRSNGCDRSVELWNAAKRCSVSVESSASAHRFRPSRPANPPDRWQSVTSPIR